MDDHSHVRWLVRARHVRWQENEKQIGRNVQCVDVVHRAVADAPEVLHPMDGRLEQVLSSQTESNPPISHRPIGKSFRWVTDVVFT
jgi:hypothetical protein